MVGVINSFIGMRGDVSCGYICPSGLIFKVINYESI